MDNVSRYLNVTLVFLSVVTIFTVFNSMSVTNPNDIDGVLNSDVFYAYAVCPPVGNATANTIFAPVLSAGPATVSSIRLTWESCDSVPSQRVYRSSLLGGGYSLIATLSGASTSYTNIGLPQGTKYYYKVSAYSPPLEEAFSNIVSKYTKPGAPTMQSATRASPTSFNLIWSDPSGYENCYKILHKRSGVGYTWTPNRYVPLSCPPQNNEGLSLSESAIVYVPLSGVSYEFKVKARNPSGWGYYSPPIIGQ